MDIGGIGVWYGVWRWLRCGYRWYRGVVWGVEVVEVWDIGRPGRCKLSRNCPSLFGHLPNERNV